MIIKVFDNDGVIFTFDEQNNQPLIKAMKQIVEKQRSYKNGTNCIGFACHIVKLLERQSFHLPIEDWAELLKLCTCIISHPFATVKVFENEDAGANQ